MSTTITLTIAEAGADSERLDQLTRTLRGELADLEIGEVRVPSLGAPPPGSRAIDVAAVGALVVLLNGSAELMGHVATLMRSWVGRGRTARVVEMTVGDKSLRISDASEEQQDRLIQEFIRAVERG